MKPLENTPDLKPALRLLTVFFICYGVAYVGSLAVFQGLQGLYPSLAKPSWNPPNWVFAPVWTILYGMMAYAAWRIYETDHPSKGIALALFGLQLAFNGLWSWLFFAWGKLGASTLEIAILWLLIATTMIVFWRIKASAGAFLLPYLAWVTFAACLNFTIWRMNPDVNGPTGSGGSNTETKITVEQSTLPTS